MEGTGSENSGSLVDPVRLGRWMDDQGLPGEGVPSCTRISGGSQNEIFEIERSGSRLVLRRPPEPVPKKRNETMMREHRVLCALADTGVPHARAIARCEDPGVLGAAFYLMEYVDGWSLAQQRRWIPPFDEDLDARAELSLAVVEAIARLASVDWEQRGLVGFGNPEGFHDRQVDRWMSQLERTASRDIPDIDIIADWLRSHRPRHFEPGIMHGDYQFANVIFGVAPSRTVAAIVDWEMATIGDPLLDLGLLLSSWPDDESPPLSTVADMSGLAPPDMALERYAAVSSRPVDEIDYYLVLAQFKLAIVLEGGYAAYVAGRSKNTRAEVYGPLVLQHAERAARRARTSSLPRSD